MSKPMTQQAHNKDTEQKVLNDSFDPEYGVIAVELLGQNGSTLKRIQTDASGNLQTVGTTSVFTTLWDSTTTPDTIYIGKAIPGTTSDQALWRIKRINTATGKVEWADGGAFTQVYDNRESLTYA